MDRASLDHLEVAWAVVHYVPTERDDPDGSLLLTDEAIDLRDGLDGYFREKIVDRLKAKGLEIVRDPDRDDCVPTAVAGVQDGSVSLVAASQQIARHLDAVQATKVNSSGLVAVVQGHIRGQGCLAILKLERERGVRFAINTVDGRHTVDLELLRNLTLTDKTKVFKTALLTQPPRGDVTGYVADDQRGLARGLRVADFFLSQFLGCKPKAPAARMTYDFVKATGEMINLDVDSPERKGRYQVALLAELQNAAADIRPADFARRHLEAEDRGPFLARVEAAGLDPQATFPKDLTDTRVARFRMTFKSGMVLVGDQESLEKKVELPKESESREPVKLKDDIESLLSGR